MTLVVEFTCILLLYFVDIEKNNFFPFYHVISLFDYWKMLKYIYAQFLFQIFIWRVNSLKQFNDNSHTALFNHTYTQKLIN